MPIDRYPIEMAKFDVGIVPLKVNRFNNAKSNLKMAEFAALGVAVIGSPTDPNCIAAELGMGVIAHDPLEWAFFATKLLSDRKMRDDLGLAARQFVIDNYTIEQNAYKWHEAWVLAKEHRGRQG